MTVADLIADFDVAVKTLRQFPQGLELYEAVESSFSAQYPLEVCKCYERTSVNPMLAVLRELSEEWIGSTGTAAIPLCFSNVSTESMLALPVDIRPALCVVVSWPESWPDEYREALEYLWRWLTLGREKAETQRAANRLRESTARGTDHRIKELDEFQKQYLKSKGCSWLVQRANGSTKCGEAVEFQTSFKTAIGRWYPRTVCSEHACVFAKKHNLSFSAATSEQGKKEARRKKP